MTTKNYGVITSMEELRTLVERIDSEGQTVGFDIETGYHGPDRPKGSLDPNYGFIVGFSITNSDQWARYVPIAHDMAHNLDPDEVWELMCPYLSVYPTLAENMAELSARRFEDPTRDLSLSSKGWKIIPHNAKFETRFMRRVGIELAVFSDSMIEAYLLSEWESVSLKKLTKAVFGHDQLEISTLFPSLKGKALEALRFNIVDVNPQTVSYACEDALWCLGLHHRNYDRVKDMLLYKVEMEIFRIVCDMEDTGVLIDWDKLRADAITVGSFEDKVLAEIKSDLSAMIGRPLDVKFNINSPPQLKKILFEELGMKVNRKTKTGADSADAVALEALSKKHPVVKKILQFRELQALRKRFLEKWPNEYSSAADGRCHASFNQVAVGTGRFAVNDPALQQCPKPPKYATGLTQEQWELFQKPKDPGWKPLWESLPNDRRLHINFRDCIMAREGYYLLDFDYSQVELRVMTGLSQEQTLLDAFNNDVDVHSVTASTMLGVSLDGLLKEQRDIGKTMNFALLYGMGVRSLADRLAVTQERAGELYDAYFNGFASITEWMDRMKRDGKAKGFTTSWAGRKYTIWELKSSNPAIYSKGERVCVNAPVQGGAADYMKIAMVRVMKQVTNKGWQGKVRLILNNHDALTFEVADELNPMEVRAALLPAVEYPVANFPKIVSDWSMGKRWGSMVELKPTSEVVWLDGVWAVKMPMEEYLASAEKEFDDTDDFVLDGPTNEHGFSTAGPAGDDDFPTFPSSTVRSSSAGSSLATSSVATMEAPPVVTQTEVQTPPGPPKTLIVELTDMPTGPQYQTFLNFCSERRGQDTILLKTPEGEVELSVKVNLTPEDQPAVSMYLGGARAYYPPESVDAEALTSGLQF